MRNLLLAMVIMIANQAIGDEVDEAAKCAATFRVLTSLELENEALGQHFTKSALFSYDLMGLYADSLRNQSMTNGEMSELITDYQLQLDSSASNGAAFVPLVASCTGWLFKVGTKLNQASPSSDNIRNVLLSASKPSSSHEYPHPDWPKMKELFSLSHSLWTDMGKITPRDVRKALEN